MAAQAHHTHGGNCSEHSHLPDLKDCRRFLCAERNSTIQLLLPLWQDDEVLDLRKFAYPGMTEHQVCSWQLLPMVTERLLAMFQAGFC